MQVRSIEWELHGIWQGFAREDFQTQRHGDTDFFIEHEIHERTKKFRLLSAFHIQKNINVRINVLIYVLINISP